MGEREWRSIWRLLRDVLAAGIGGFMLLHETFDRTPNPELLVTGLALLGVPPALRADKARRERQAAERDGAE